MATRLVSVGFQPLRYEEHGAERLVPRPSWNATIEDGSVIGTLFKAAVGSYEYWVDGEMEEFATFADARSFITGEA